MSQQPSGIDLARAALAAARADAKTRPTQPDRKQRRRERPSTRSYGDPMGLGAAITRMMTERDWQPPEPGGSILDQWPAIASELADKVAAVRFEHDTGTLHLRPVSPAYGTQLRMFRPQILRRIHDKTGDSSVKDLRILPPGISSGTDSDDSAEPVPEPTAVGPVKTRDTAHPGYRATLALALEHRGQHQRVDLYEEQARARQEAALRAGRQPEGEHREAVWETDRLESARVDQAEAVRQAAIARARRERAGGTEPRRLFGAA
ncbi:DciA family protein [Streptomyces ardesiacus]|uniref:DciA family protein n=1 Tax=Streptomyces ardesiacus TaxID=285564 RepID=UPI0036A645B3